MTKLYLVTGFLGAGKTTFLHQFVRLFPEERLALLINEFGREGVDGTLLSDLNVELTEIDNGSIFCACKIEQFEDALLMLQDKAPDAIFVEASGLSDPTAVGSILAQRQKFPNIEYRGAICLVDAVRFHKVYRTARVCRMQLAISDLVLINKTDLAGREQIDDITAIVKAQKPNRPVFETTFGNMERAWLEAMETQIPDPDDAPPAIHTKDITLQKLTLTVEGFDRKDLTSFLRMFAEDTYRIKGIVTLPEGVFVCDCVGPLVELRPFDGPAPEGNKLAVLFGNGLPARKGIREAVSWFPQAKVTVE